MASDPERTLVVAGAVYTMDPGQPLVTGVLVEAGRVLAVGDATRLRRRYPGAERVSVPGIVTPGIIDAHVHARELGSQRSRADLTGVDDVGEMVARRRAHRTAHPHGGDWLLGAGWDEGAWASRGYPDRAALDAAFPDTPVALLSLHGFAGLFNGEALARAGLLESPVTVSTGEAGREPEDGGAPAGKLLRRPDGTPTGVLLGALQQRVTDVIPPPSVEVRAQWIEEALEVLLAAGVTTVHEAGVTAEDLPAWMLLWSQGRLPTRARLLLDGNDPALVDAFEDIRAGQDPPGGRLRVLGFKVFYDGSLGSRTALLHAPYHDEPGSHDAIERLSLPEVRALAARAATMGAQLAVHAIGDRANDNVLDVIEQELGASAPSARWRIEHAQVVSPTFFSRAASLGVVASMQPSHAVGDARWAPDRLGLERLTRAYAWRTMLDAGVPLIFNSDLPGEPWRPEQTLAFAVTRDGAALEVPFEPEQSVTPSEALTAMTATSGWASFEEGQLGMLTPGAVADFVVWDVDPTSVSTGPTPASIVQVWLDGQRVETAVR